MGIFRLLANTLSRLEAQSNPETVTHFYEIRLLDMLGFRPQLFECVDCGREIQAQDQFFSPLAGGVVCPECGGSRVEAWNIQQDVLRYLRHLQRSKWQQIANVVIPQTIDQRLTDLMQRYLTYLLERNLNSPEFLREIRGNEEGSER